MSEPDSSAASAASSSAFARSLTAAAVAAALLVAALTACFRLWNNDVWWHLATGRWMAEAGQAPSHDVFSYVLTDRQWIDIAWLFQLAIHGLWRVADAAGLVALKMALGAAVAGVLLLLRRPGRSVLWVLVPVLLALPVVRLRFVVRPELVTLLLVAVWLVVLETACFRRRTRWVWALPALQILWVNLHGLFVLGPIVVGVYLAGAIAERVVGRRPAEHGTASLGALALVLVGCAAACVVNPYGVAGALFPLELYTRISGGLPVFQRVIGELIPPTRIGLADPSVAWSLVLGVLAALSFAPLGRRVRFGRVLVLGAFAFLGFRAGRNLGLAAMVAGAVTALNLLDATEGRAWLARRWARRLGSIVAVLVVLVCAGWAWGLASGELYRLAGDNREFGLGRMRKDQRPGVHAFIRQADPPGRVFITNLDQAAVFLFHHFPGRRVFCDGRLEVYDAAYFSLYRRVRASLRDDQAAKGERPLWLETFDRHGIQHVLVDATKRKIQRVLDASSRWRMVYYDPYVCFFTRVDTPEGRAFADRWATSIDAESVRPGALQARLAALTPAECERLSGFYLNLRRPLAALQVLRHVGEGQAARRPSRVAELRRQLLPPTAVGGVRLGQLDSRELRVGQVTAGLLSALASDPADAPARLDLGAFYAATGRLLRAERVWAGLGELSIDARGQRLASAVRRVLERDLPAVRERIKHGRSRLGAWLKAHSQAPPAERAIEARRLGFEQMAESLLRARLLAAPSDGAARVLLVQICLRNGEPKAARGLLTATPAGSVPSGYLGLLMADVLRLEGKVGQAAEALRQVEFDRGVARLVRVKQAEMALEQGDGPRALNALEDAASVLTGPGDKALDATIEFHASCLRALLGTAGPATQPGAQAHRSKGVSANPPR